jgi:hypothetical protein
VSLSPNRIVDRRRVDREASGEYVFSLCLDIKQAATLDLQLLNPHVRYMIV